MRLLQENFWRVLNKKKIILENFEYFAWQGAVFAFCQVFFAGFTNGVRPFDTKGRTPFVKTVKKQIRIRQHFHKDFSQSLPYNEPIIAAKEQEKRNNERNYHTDTKTV
mgnify:CR=1 FL=1|jgi:hypothetical protein